MIDILIPMLGQGAYEWPLSDTIEGRFWAKVDTSGECWAWLAFRNPAGYGMIRNGQRMALAHRVAWVLENGRVSTGLHVLHQCDNRGCVRASHLYTGTNSDNVADKVARGRSSFPRPDRRGERHPMAKLTQRDVDEIRRLRGRVTGRALADMFKVSPSTVCLIQKGKLW